MRVTVGLALVPLLVVTLACSSSTKEAQPTAPDCAEEIDPNRSTIDAAACDGITAVAWFFEPSTPSRAVGFLVYRRVGDEPRPWEMQHANTISALTVFRDADPDEFETRNLFSDIVLYGQLGPEEAELLCRSAVQSTQRTIDELGRLQGALCLRVDPYGPTETVPPISDTGAANAVGMLIDGFSFGAQVSLNDRYLQLAPPELVAAMDAGHPWSVDTSSCTPEGCLIRGSNGATYFVGVRDDGYITTIEQR